MADATHAWVGLFCGAVGWVDLDPTNGLQRMTSIAVARNWGPDAIILNADVKALQQLKQLPETRHIPVYMVGTPELRQDALQTGAAGYLEMPIGDAALDQALDDVKERMEQRVKRVLVVDDNDIERDSIGELIGGGDDIEIVTASSSEEALDALERESRIDCIVLDLKLPKMTGFQLLERIGTDQRFQHIPVIVHTGKELTRREETKLRKYAKTIVVKDVRSPDRLLAETALFLHRPQSAMPAEQRRMLEEANRAEVVFAGHEKVVRWVAEAGDDGPGIHVHARVVGESAPERGQFAAIIACAAQCADKFGGAFFGCAFGFTHG